MQATTMQYISESTSTFALSRVLARLSYWLWLSNVKNAIKLFGTRQTISIMYDVVGCFDFFFLFCVVLRPIGAILATITVHYAFFPLSIISTNWPLAHIDTSTRRMNAGNKLTNVQRNSTLTCIHPRKCRTLALRWRAFYQIHVGRHLGNVRLLMNFDWYGYFVCFSFSH